ncbi:hypothetical protein Pmar_PMAR003938 [Perkinsus marinus ATCC 50983]|uniref:Uncharacterized protein n=1 Tax=Perkinsus marinus (strain ATCC 50983 / TXsc) TaxID=423536 RepID=C5L858_PERM5|nr:hypothetical protein Pmar_PMAR003938 [Perkinsus marinus ATCC 50983]EER07084.1 hypothetical protein Pmar_PMAR003938 [Perkinsus marinus ATCC 50983]|eukprot:XP_002775268.1 hypothetical protein Pmar_PMAR003938 [Perkinsus marinus ATCC 50983]
MNLTIKTTASEELDKLADLRGRLALEARREEKRKEEEARRLAVGRRAMIKVAASEERETVRRKAVQGRAEENPNLPSPVRRAKQRLAKSLKMEAERRQREEEEKSKTQAEIFRKRDERINRYLARQREKLKKVPGRKPERKSHSIRAIAATSPVDGRVFLSEAQARDFNRAVIDPISPVEEVPRSPRLPDSLASSESVDIEDESELIDDLLIGI